MKPTEKTAPGSTESGPCPCSDASHLIVGTRRAFLQSSGGVVAIAAVSSVAALGCGDEDDDRLARDVTISVSDFPALASTGGIATIPSSITGTSSPIFVRNEGDGVFRALSGYCPHAGCSVAPSSAGFSCPCHGSTFAADGTLRTGPASRGLATYDTEVDGDRLTIRAS